MKRRFITQPFSMVEVFKTNITRKKQATLLAGILAEQFPFYRINFDLQDCDNILRIEGHEVVPDKIIETLKLNGYHCEVLC